MDAYRDSMRYQTLPSETNVTDYRGAGDIELSTHDGDRGFLRQQHDGNAFLFSDNKTRTIQQQSSADDVLLPKHQDQRRRRRFLQGWRFGGLASLIGAVSVFILNLTITIWVYKNPKYDVVDGVGTLFQGSCARVRNLNVWLHLVVNVLSTLLLCASNYCMQVLSAPNRAEVDRAHASRHWLHIGVPNFHNLMRIAPDRSILWIMLMFSSLPLHLLFNSVVFTNLQANNYLVVPTMEDWLYGAAYNISGFLDYNNATARSVARDFDKFKIDLSDTIALSDGSVVPRYMNVSTAECFDRYSTQYTTDIGNVFLIQSEPTVMRQEPIWWLGVDSAGDLAWRTGSEVNSDYTRVDTDAKFPFLSNPGYFPSNGWRCPWRRNATCNVNDEKEVPADRSQWKPYESPVRYCIVEKVQEICKLQFNFLIAIIVIVSNVIKAGVIAWVLFRYQSHHALVTLGDAIASFLEYPDRTTRGRCLQSHKQAQLYFNARTFAEAPATGKDVNEPGPVRCTIERKHWMHAPSYGRWFGTYMFYAAVIFASFMGIGWTAQGMPKDPGQLWKVGFGSVNGNNLWGVPTTLMRGVLLANSPQVVLSYLYLAFNGVYTNMFIAKEWSTFLHKRKPLRVTAPVGQQRNTYWLTVPFRFAIPMTIVSGIFHWLASQSLFMVQITVTDAKTREISEKDQISTLGFSPFALILASVLATLIAASGIAVGRLKFPAGMPVAGSSSAAISAGCHRRPEDTDAQLLPVQWGVVSRGDETSEDSVGHCSFSSFPVEQPIPGQLYA